MPVTSELAVVTSPVTLKDPAVRGVTTIDDRVVRKVAAQAVAEQGQASGASRRVLGKALGSADENTAARVQTRVDGNLVSLSVVLSVPWPQSIRQVTSAVRESVRHRVQQITGFEVVDIDIEVTQLRTAAASRPRVE